MHPVSSAKDDTNALSNKESAANLSDGQRDRERERKRERERNILIVNAHQSNAKISKVL